MRCVLRHWRRLLLAGFLLGLGYVLYQRLPPVERWSVRLEKDTATIVFSFSADGRSILNYIPAAVGIVLLLLGKWRQVRKARKAKLANQPGA